MKLIVRSTADLVTRDLFAVWSDPLIRLIYEYTLGVGARHNKPSSCSTPGCETAYPAQKAPHTPAAPKHG